VISSAYIRNMFARGISARRSNAPRDATYRVGTVTVANYLHRFPLCCYSGEDPDFFLQVGGGGLSKCSISQKEQVTFFIFEILAILYNYV